MTNSNQENKEARYMGRVMIDKLESGSVLTIPEKYVLPYRGEQQQCPLCGARSKLTHIGNRLVCGVCSRSVAWE